MGKASGWFFRHEMSDLFASMMCTVLHGYFIYHEFLDVSQEVSKVDMEKVS